MNRLSPLWNVNEHGLLNFEYVARKITGGQDVQIFRIVDGREVVNPDFTVTVTKDGVIVTGIRPASMMSARPQNTRW